ncbi:MAG: alkaline phosphatase D family protein [Burkholderiales bacterium]|nr:alkaline phosphatase D family protein [Burkholderiales bacterium]
MRDRRTLLKLAAAGAATVWLPRSAWSQPVMSADPFTLGVASGSPEERSVVLWTRLGNSEEQGQRVATVRWELAHDEGFRQVVRQGQALALPQLGHSVHVEVPGLEPDRWYHYRFTAGDWMSAVGRTRTLPAADAVVQKLRIAYASCQRWEHGWYSAWRHLREEQPDFVVFLGDYIYEYPTAVRAVREPGGGWVLTLAGYRQRHALYRSDANLRSMHAACPWLVTWDDHELQNDYAADFPGNAGPQVDHAARRAAAYQAYYEHMPLRASAFEQAMGRLRVNSHLRFGRLAQLTLLDTRQFRDPQACTRGGRPGSDSIDPDRCAGLGDPQRTLLGAAQEQWLAARLAAASGGWNVIGQSTLFGLRDQRPGPGQLLWNDRWDGYPAARARLVQSLQKHEVRNFVMLGGDVHQNWVGHVKADYSKPDSASVGVEFCGTSITSRPSAGDKVARDLAENPHFVFADAERRGYGVADFTPGRLTVRLRTTDDVEKRDSGISTLATFTVAAGQPELEKA